MCRLYHSLSDLRTYTLNCYAWAHAWSLSCVELFVTPWTVGHQAPLSVGFFKQEYWSGLPFPTLGDLHDNEIKPTSPVSPALQVDSLLLRNLGSHLATICCCYSITKSCPTLCISLNYITPGFPVLRYLPEFAQTHIHRVCDAIQTSHPLLPPSSPALNLVQHQGLFQWVGSSHQVAKIL